MGDRVRLADGQAYPVIVRRVRNGQAEAIWYDEANEVWKEVREPAARRRLARQVEAGRLEVWDPAAEAQP